MKNLDEYHDLYVQSVTLLLANVSESFWSKFIGMYKLDSAHFLSAPGLAWQTTLKKIKVLLELLTEIGMLIIVEKCIRGGICHAIYRHANSKYMKNFDRNKELSCLMY